MIYVCQCCLKKHFGTGEWCQSGIKYSGNGAETVVRVDLSMNSKNRLSRDVEKRITNGGT